MTLPITAFTDKEGRVWDVALDLSIAYRIDGLDTLKTFGDDMSILEPSDMFFKKALFQPRFMFTLIWLIVLEQVKDRLKDVKGNPIVLSWDTKGKLIFDDQYFAAEMLFVRAFDGKSISAAKLALQNTFLDFFRDQETVLSNLINQIKEANRKIEAELLSMNPLVAETLDKHLATRKETILQDFEDAMSLGGSSSSTQP